MNSTADNRVVTVTTVTGNSEAERSRPRWSRRSRRPQHCGFTRQPCDRMTRCDDGARFRRQRRASAKHSPSLRRNVAYLFVHSPKKG